MGRADLCAARSSGSPSHWELMGHSAELLFLDTCGSLASRWPDRQLRHLFLAGTGKVSCYLAQRTLSVRYFATENPDSSAVFIGAKSLSQRRSQPAGER